MSTPQPRFTISDAAHGGIAHFYFLPPMVSAPTPQGTFDPGVSPVVEICEWNGSSCAGTPLATFSTVTGPGSETVRLDAADELYIVNWHTDQFTLSAGSTYRIRVSVAGAAVAYADVQLFPTAGSAKNASTGDVIALIDGKTLPIKFRIELGMPVAISVAPNPASVIVNKTTVLTAALSDAHGNAVIDQPVAWSASPSTVALVDPSGRVAGISPGTATVTASSNGLSASAQVTVVIPPVSSVVVAPAQATVTAGETIQLTATTYDADGNVLTGRAITWSSSNSTGASVSAAGVVTGVQPSTYTITATSEGVSGNASVVVSPAGFTVTLGSITRGDTHTCGIAGGGKAYCWGDNSFGELGAGTLGGHSSRPTPVAGGVQFKNIFASSNVTCGVSVDGHIYCWGVDGFGATNTAPTLINSSASFAAVAGTCALDVNGRLWCWGSYDPTKFGIPVSTTPVASSDTRAYVAIAAGPNTTCLTTSSGDVRCGGNLGVDLNGVGFHGVVVGRFHVCALDSVGDVWCWGDNSPGIFGNGTTISSTGIPVRGPTGMHFTALAASDEATCGPTPAGDVYCWGSNRFGELGNGTFTSTLTPIRVTSSIAFASLAGEYADYCATTAGGAVYCWGDNGQGVLGDGTSTTRTVPTQVVPPSP